MLKTMYFKTCLLRETEWPWTPCADQTKITVLRVSYFKRQDHTQTRYGMIAGTSQTGKQTQTYLSRYVVLIPDSLCRHRLATVPQAVAYSSPCFISKFLFSTTVPTVGYLIFSICRVKS